MTTHGLNSTEAGQDHILSQNAKNDQAPHDVPSRHTPNAEAPHRATAQGGTRTEQRHEQRPQRRHERSTNHAGSSAEGSSKRARHSGSSTGRRHKPRKLTPEQIARRKASIPHISYPDLPVSTRKDDIARAIADNQVVVIAGETGSGKTTQIPKICLEIGRGVNGMIGHTQPRRIAARAVAERISEELGTELGGIVGYQVRFTDVVSSRTLIKLMTDGILLAEIQNDPMLLAYDTIIIDEAHERSLNIDFLLGYLARLLPQRPDLKLIITSATIDTERFAEHFGKHRYLGGPHAEPAPIIEVSGRTYPVEIRYRPLTSDTWDGEAPGESRESGASSGVDDASPRGDDANAPSDTATSSAYSTPSTSSTPAPSATPNKDYLDKILAEWNAKQHAEPPRHSSTKKSSKAKKKPSEPATPGRVSAIDQVTGILNACDELMGEGSGDILVFLSGEGEIRDTLSALQSHLGNRYLAPGEKTTVPGATEVLPLYGRLSSAEQHRIFTPHSHRRIVLATNIAETSLTVPGIHYVVDPGTARISRYSNRTKVQRLPIEPISQASANQRSGRSGRTADGIAIRLYSQDDFENRDEFTQPEIQRTSLASVILQMASLGLGEVDDFPFIDPPDPRAVRAGVQLLEEIGALRPRSDAQSRPADPASEAQGGSQSRTLTRIGRQLAQLPIDPRLGRMLIEAEKNGCASEVLVIVAALSVQDVRERPTEKRVQADQYHARFVAHSSDFLAYLTLWRYLHTQQRELSGSAFRRMMRDEYLNYLRYREWTDVVSQLIDMARPLGLTIHSIALPTAEQIAEARRAHPRQSDAVAEACRALGRSADTPEAASIHQSLLIGLLSNIGNFTQKTKDYLGARGTHFVIWPGSGLHGSTPSWVMTAELVETSRLFARTVAAIDPAWVEPLAQHLVKRTYTEPGWSERRGTAMVTERVTLYGMTLVADRRVQLSRIRTPNARSLARELFIRHALVSGEARIHAGFVQHNREAIAQAHMVEEKLREPGLMVSDREIEDFFDRRIPEDVVSVRHFESWWKKEQHKHPHLLDFTQDFLLRGKEASSQEYPTTWEQDGLTLQLAYTYAPGEADDGITALIPVTLLPQVREAGFDWLVPGMLGDLVLATIRSLPKRVRRMLVPAPDVARDVLAHLPAWDSVAHGQVDAPSFRQAFTDAVLKTRGFQISDDDWENTRLPDSMRIRFRVVGEKGETLGTGYSLRELRMRLADQTKAAVEDVTHAAVAQALADVKREAQAAMRAGRSFVHDDAGDSESDTAQATSDNVHAASSTVQATSNTARATSNAGTRQEKKKRVAISGSFNLNDLNALAALHDAFAEAEAAEQAKAEARTQEAEKKKEAARKIFAASSATHKPAAPTPMRKPAAAPTRANPASQAPTRNETPNKAVHQEDEDLLFTEWPPSLDVLQDSVSASGRYGLTVRGYPAFAPAQGRRALAADGLPSVTLDVVAEPGEQVREHTLGIYLLLAHALMLPELRVTTRLSEEDALNLAASPYQNLSALITDIQLAAAIACTQEWTASRSITPSDIRSLRAFNDLHRWSRDRFEDRVFRIATTVSHINAEWAATVRSLDSQKSDAMAPTVRDLRAQLTALVPEGFVSATVASAPGQLAEFPRYLKAMQHRITKAVNDPEADDARAARADEAAALIDDAREASSLHPYSPRTQAVLTQARWMLEELRVSLFAQQLGTKGKASIQRIRKLLATIDGYNG
ncbi:MAG: DUF3418 domain-containing protein [Actinomycetaceae bacterium]|nr:DUF3418 domain-containing protein [Actinomycetaceae bacterium]